MEIRKISIGPDYKSGGMHFLVGQSVLIGRHTIHLFKYSMEQDADQTDEPVDTQVDTQQSTAQSS